MKSTVLSLLVPLLSLVLPLTAAVSDLEPRSNLLNNPESVVHDISGCRYLVSNWGDGNNVSIDTVGNQTYFNTEMDQAAGLHINPADIYFNTISDVLAVPNFHGNSVDLVPLNPMSSMPDAEIVSFEPSIRIYPNPFRYVTRMKVSIPSGVPDGNLTIYSLDGRLLRTFSDSGESSSFEWNGTDRSGNSVPPGIYVAVFETASTAVSGRVVIVLE